MCAIASSPSQHRQLGTLASRGSNESRDSTTVVTKPPFLTTHCNIDLRFSIGRRARTRQIATSTSGRALSPARIGTSGGWAEGCGHENHPTGAPPSLRCRPRASRCEPASLGNYNRHPCASPTCVPAPPGGRTGWPAADPFDTGMGQIRVAARIWSATSYCEAAAPGTNLRHPCPLPTCVPAPPGGRTECPAGRRISGSWGRFSRRWERRGGAGGLGAWTPS